MSFPSSRSLEKRASEREHGVWGDAWAHAHEHGNASRTRIRRWRLRASGPTARGCRVALITSETAVLLTSFVERGRGDVEQGRRGALCP